MLLEQKIAVYCEAHTKHTHTHTHTKCGQNAKYWCWNSGYTYWQL